MANADVSITLDGAVAEVLGMLTGLDMTYAPEFDRYRAVARQINRALRANALEHDWSYYSDTEVVGTAHAGDQVIALRSSVRPRIVGDDSVRFVDSDGRIRVWAYLLPRDALHKYVGRKGLYASTTRNLLEFSKPFSSGMEGLEIQVPVMREPKMFDLPDPSESTVSNTIPVPAATRQQLVDFDYPDVVIQRAAYLYAQSDPVMQPRVQTLEAQYKNLMYQLIERDDKHTDAPFLNEFFVPISNAPGGPGSAHHSHPHSDYRR